MRFLAFLLFLIFILLAIVLRWFFVCELLHQCAEEAPVVVEVPRANTLELTQADSVLLSDYDEFAFDRMSYQPTLNKNNELFLDTLASLLQADTTLGLTITGFYLEQEGDAMPGFFDNLGMARADAVRSLLIDRGLSTTEISIDHGISIDTNLVQPLAFELYETALPAEFEKMVNTFENINFFDSNFEVNSAVFKPGQAFVAYADSVLTYLSTRKDKRLVITGHTDSDASDAYNYKLGLARSESAKAYFLQKGIAAEIVTNSRGETKPVAPNDTPENKQKNRRVNVVIE